MVVEPHHKDEVGMWAHARAVGVTVLAAVCVVGMASLLAPAACHTRADALLTQWACVLPLSFMYVAPWVAVVSATAAWVRRHVALRLPSGWGWSIVVGALVGQSVVGATMYAFNSDYLNWTNFWTFILFPQALISGAVAGFVYRIALRLGLPASEVPSSES